MNAPRRPPRLKVDGVVLLDKPSGLSSNAVLQRVRRVFNAAKAGHTGTLDPLASGLLPLCFGEATKFAQTLLEADKSYEAELCLGVRTDTGDAEGVVVESREANCVAEEFVSACSRFVGTIEQTPPMHSALKVAGRPLYEYARSGVILERQPRTVRIQKIEVLAFAGSRARISVDCSKGTYIRVLAEDIGALLGCGAQLAGLRRTRIGRFEVRDAVELERLEADLANASDWLQPADHLITDWTKVELMHDAARAFGHGQAVALGPQPSAGRDVRVYGPDEQFLGTGEVEGSFVRPKRVVGAVASP